MPFFLSINEHMQWVAMFALQGIYIWTTIQISNDHEFVSLHTLKIKVIVLRAMF